MASNDKYYSFIGRRDSFLDAIKIDYSKNFFVQNSDVHDDQVIEEAKRINNIIKQKFTDDNCGFGESLFMVYQDVKNNESRLNDVTVSYLNHNFKNETEFRCYYMRHKNAPVVPFDKKA